MVRSLVGEVGFWLMVVASFILPFVIYGVLLVRRTVSRLSVLAFGFVLIGIAGLDVHFLLMLQSTARLSVSTADDVLLRSEVSVALYILPAMFGGVGVNLISHLLVSHLVAAEKRFVEENPAARTREYRLGAEPVFPHASESRPQTEDSRVPARRKGEPCSNRHS